MSWPKITAQIGTLVFGNWWSKVCSVAIAIYFPVHSSGSLSKKVSVHTLFINSNVVGRGRTLFGSWWKSRIFVFRICCDLKIENNVEFLENICLFAQWMRLKGLCANSGNEESNNNGRRSLRLSFEMYDRLCEFALLFFSALSLRRSCSLWCSRCTCANEKPK